MVLINLPRSLPRLVWYHYTLLEHSYTSNTAPTFESVLSVRMFRWNSIKLIPTPHLQGSQRFPRTPACKMQNVRCQGVSVSGRSSSLSHRLPCADCCKTVLPHTRRTHQAVRAQTRQYCIQAQLNEHTIASTGNNRRACLLGIAAVSLLSASDAR